MFPRPCPPVGGGVPRAERHFVASAGLYVKGALRLGARSDSCRIPALSRNQMTDTAFRAMDVPGKAGNQVNVDVENGLPRGRSRIDPDVEAVGSKGRQEAVARRA